MLGELTTERYISLTTFRRDGSAASTPVWVVSDDGKRLLVWTGAETWKVKRIRRDPRVQVAAADYRGRERGPRIEAHARILEAGAETIIGPLLRRKYGWQRRGLELQGRIARLVTRNPAPASVYLELT
jgi:uncharacterized protein